MLKRIREDMNKRIVTLEQTIPSNDSCPPAHCTLSHRLKRYKAYFSGEYWQCVASPERKAELKAKLAYYNQVFDKLEEIEKRSKDIKL